MIGITGHVFLMIATTTTTVTITVGVMLKATTAQRANLLCTGLQRLL